MKRTLLALFTGKPGQSRRRRVAHTALAVLAVLFLIGLVAPEEEPDRLDTSGTAERFAAPAPSRTPSPAVSPTPSRTAASPVPSRTVAAVPPRPSRSPAASPQALRRLATPAPRPAATRPPAPAPKPKPKPPAPRTCGAPANPWGYHHCGGGSTISSPPGNFCDYFSCIGAFWDGVGYVIRCDDGDYSKSGGRRGACSHHGGVDAPLYK